LEPAARSALFGYTAEEAVGKPVTILIPTDRHDEELVILERVHRGESVENYETIRQRGDGSLVDISLTVSPIKNAKRGTRHRLEDCP
jgi:PAS domain S-box-containing protein